MDKNPTLQEEVAKVISLNFGEQTALLYSNFFDKEDPKTLISSARELLIELLGKQKADEQLVPVCQKFNIALS